jgi:hypothetical protein
VFGEGIKHSGSVLAPFDQTMPTQAGQMLRQAGLAEINDFQ